MKEIYLAGGCFWGTEKYLGMIRGVQKTEVGYANGHTANPRYEEVCGGSGHAETVKVIYDEEMLSLAFLLDLFYEAIDPVSLNRQGGDTGVQYRTGIYYVDNESREMILHSIEELQKKYQEKIAIEVKRLENFYTAEEYHQNYLQKNPTGYCHIRPSTFVKANKAFVDSDKYHKKEQEFLQTALTPIQYDVTQKNVTEAPFQNTFYDHFEEGIYVDITSGEPLFTSLEKFDSGCGWPSFYAPVAPNVVVEKRDTSHNMIRTEVRSNVGDAHLGHLFEDGPTVHGGMRYCINSAALKFIPKNDMEKEGYGSLLKLFEKQDS